MSRYLSLAGLTCELQGEGLRINDSRDPAYRPFLSTSKPAGGSPLPAVRLTARPGPPLESLEKIFDTEESWAMYRRGPRRFMGRYVGDGPERELLWLAEIDRAAEVLEIFCRPPMIRERGGERWVENPLCYPLDQVLFMYLLGGEGIIAHGAGAVRKGRGWIFAGPSGAGKSTIAKIMAAQGYRILSDDRVAVRGDGEGCRAYGTPWPGEAGFADGGSAPLAGLAFLTKGAENRLREIPPRQALARLLPVASLPWYDREALDAPLSFCETLLAGVPAYDLTFHPDLPLDCWGSGDEP